MAYIVRMNLVTNVVAVVLRDLRDGLFQGVKFGPTDWQHSVSTFLRLKLVYDAEAEKHVLEVRVVPKLCFLSNDLLQCMEPSAEHVAARARLTQKRESLMSLKTEIARCQSKITKLVAVLCA